jgi:hypothetical protein
MHSVLFVFACISCYCYIGRPCKDFVTELSVTGGTWTPPFEGSRTTRRGTRAPLAASPRLASPRLASPRLASPRLASPHVPHITYPHSSTKCVELSVDVKLDDKQSENASTDSRPNCSGGRSGTGWMTTQCSNECFGAPTFPLSRSTDAIYLRSLVHPRCIGGMTGLAAATSALTPATYPPGLDSPVTVP